MIHLVTAHTKTLMGAVEEFHDLLYQNTRLFCERNVIYYRCDLCRKEQGLDEARGQVHADHNNPLGQVPLKLPEEIKKSFPDVEDICVDCNGAIRAAVDKIYKQATADARSAVRRVVTDLSGISHG